MPNHISKYSNNKEVSAAQYITELICENYAILNKKDLHYRFWLNKEWCRYYKSQIGFANKLLAKYEDVDIISAIRSPAGKKIYSLRAPHLPQIIEQWRDKRLQTNQTKQNQDIRTISRTLTSEGSKINHKKNILDKLKEIE